MGALVGPVVEKSIEEIAENPGLLRKLGTTLYGFARRNMGVMVRWVGTGLTLEGLYEIVHTWWTGREPNEREKQEIRKRLKDIGLDPNSGLSGLTHDQLAAIVKGAAPEDASPADLDDFVSVLTHASQAMRAGGKSETVLEASHDASILEERKVVRDMLLRAAQASSISVGGFIRMLEVLQTLPNRNPVVVAAVFEELRNTY